MHIAKSAFVLVVGLATTSFALPVSSQDATLSPSEALRASRIVVRDPSEGSVPDWDNAVIARAKLTSSQPETIKNSITPFKRSQPKEPKEDSINNRITPFKRSQPEEPSEDIINNRIIPFKRSQSGETPAV